MGILRQRMDHLIKTEPALSIAHTEAAAVFNASDPVFFKGLIANDLQKAADRSAMGRHQDIHL